MAKRTSEMTRIVEARDAETLALRKQWDGTEEHLAALAGQLAAPQPVVAVEEEEEPLPPPVHTAGIIRKR